MKESTPEYKRNILIFSADKAAGDRAAKAVAAALEMMYLDAEEYVRYVIGGTPEEVIAKTDKLYYRRALDAAVSECGQFDGTCASFGLAQLPSCGIEKLIEGAYCFSLSVSAENLEREFVGERAELYYRVRTRLREAFRALTAASEAIDGEDEKQICEHLICALRGRIWQNSI